MSRYPIILAGLRSLDDLTRQVLSNHIDALANSLTNAITYRSVQKQSVQLEEANIELLDADRQKSDFLANMSHELRTPLNSIIGFSGILQKNRKKNLTHADLSRIEKINRNGRHLLYIPTGEADPNVVFAGGFQTGEFFAWVARQGFRPGFLSRNGTHARWSGRVDLGVHQDFPLGFKSLNGRFYFRMYNLLNFINDDWGKVCDAFSTTPHVVQSSINAAGQYVFEDFDEQSVTDLLEIRSLWQARFGVEIRF